MNDNGSNLSKHEKWLPQKQAVVLAAVLAAVSSFITLLLIATRSKKRKLPIQSLEEPEALSKSLHLSWDSDPLSVRLSGPLSVQLVKPEVQLTESEKKVSLSRAFLQRYETVFKDPFFRVLLTVASLAFTLSAGLTLLTIAQSVPPPVEGLVIPVSISLAYPTYVSPKEENHIDVTLVNQESREITCTATIVFTGPLQIAVPLGESTTLHFGNLKTGELRTQRVRFSLIRKHIFSQFFNKQQVGFKLRLETEDGQKEDVVDIWTIGLIPIANAKTGTNMLTFTTVLYFLVLLLTPHIRQYPGFVKLILPPFVTGLISIVLRLIELEFR